MRVWLGFVVALASTVATVAQAPPSFSVRSDLVVLHVAVTDHRGAYTSGLNRDAFAVFEDGVQQPIVVFGAEDSPATVGLLVDDSASMYGLRELVSVGAAAFAATSNRADEIFALTFNERVRRVLPEATPFTSDPDVLRASLQTAIGARGRTALYDAVSSGLEQLSLGVHSRKVLVVLSDGGDNASTTTMEQMVAAATASNTVIYTIALRDPDDASARPKLLKKMAQSSGGMAFEPHSPAGVGDAFSRVARDIRASYSIAYAPSQDGAARRQVRVTARAPDGAKLAARTRAEYIAR